MRYVTLFAVNWLLCMPALAHPGHDHSGDYLSAHLLWIIAPAITYLVFVLLYARRFNSGRIVNKVKNKK